MKWLLLAASLLLSGADRPAEPRATSARGDLQSPDNVIPLPVRGACPRSFQPWRWDGRRLICVRRA